MFESRFLQLQMKLPKYTRTLKNRVPVEAKHAFGNGLTLQGFDLLERLLCLNPQERITAEAALEHPW